MRKIKQLIIVISILWAFLGAGQSSHAAEDLRVIKMRSYLTQVKSPMADQAELLITTAQQYGLDWTLLAAIAGTESTFGKRMPYQCVNPYGWGIYGDHKLCFRDFPDAIKQVAAGLSAKYNTTSVATIARRYNTVSTEGWISHTTFFMNKIKNYDVGVHELPIEL